jgi:hypothetical protein
MLLNIILGGTLSALLGATFETMSSYARFRNVTRKTDFSTVNIFSRVVDPTLF